jgi:hypothetical protein
MGGVIDHDAVAGDATDISSAEVSSSTRKRPRDVIDVAAAALVVDHAAHGQRVGNQGNVDGGVDITALVPVGGRGVAGVHHRFSYIELRFVRDVTYDTRLRARAEEGALRTLQDLDAVEIRRVDVKIAVWKLRGLLIEIHRDVREGADDTRPL